MSRLERLSRRRHIGAVGRSSTATGRRALLTALLTLVALGRTDGFVSPASRSASRLGPLAAPSPPRTDAALQMASDPPSGRPQRVPKRASPSRHIRLRPRSLRGDRRKFDIQTAITTYTKMLPDGSEAKVDLHAQIHVGERSYYDYYSDPEFEREYDRVHYELVVGDDLLASGDGKKRVLRPAADGGNPLAASPSDVGMARGYGLACQVDSINYARDGWVHADYSREEFVQLAAERRGNEGQKANDASTDSRPIWALASAASASALPLPGALAEFISALQRPLSPSVPLSSPVVRRLFSNLFLPGDALAAFIRSVLWVAVPSPEAFVMLLDWSSLSPRPTGGISPTALPVLECLLSGNVPEARKLVFGQMVVSGQSLAENSAGDDASDLLLNKRNDKAMEVLCHSIEVDGCRRNALLFGGTHCRGLDERLKSMGFTPKKTEWRTAWSVEAPKFGLGFGDGIISVSGGSSRSAASAFAGTTTPDGLAVAFLAVPLYLAIGGWDWVGTLSDVGRSLEGRQILDAGLEVALYLVRHVALYLGLSKFVVEWDGASLFGTGGVEGNER